MEEITESERRIFEQRELLEERLNFLESRKRKIRNNVRIEEIEIRKEHNWKSLEKRD